MTSRNRERIGNVSHADLVGLVLELLDRVEVLEADDAALRKENAALRAENAALKAENAELKARMAKLEEQVRASKRATAPFLKGKGKAHPKKPGRKTGVGIFGNSETPIQCRTANLKRADGREVESRGFCFRESPGLDATTRPHHPPVPADRPTFPSFLVVRRALD